MMMVILGVLVFSIALGAQTSGEGWTRIGIFSGDITALAVSPAYKDDTTLFIGVKGGGLWRSSDRGNIWHMCTGVPCDSTVTGIALPKDYAHGHGNPVFAVTEEGNFYRSDDDFANVTFSHTFLDKLGTGTVPCRAIVIDGLSYFDSNYGHVYVATWGYGVWENDYAGDPGAWNCYSLSTPNLDLCHSLTITSQTPQTVWASSQAGGYTIWYCSGYDEWVPRTPTALVEGDVLTIHASWANSQYMWAGSPTKGMWSSSDYGSTWSTACDGSTSGNPAVRVQAVADCPASATDHEVWEGRSDGLRTSTNYGAACVDAGRPKGCVNVIEFSPSYHGSGGYCDAFVGTTTALYRLNCSEGQTAKAPQVVDGKAVALAHGGLGKYMGSLSRGLFKCVDGNNMVEYNNFPNGQIPQIVAICLDPLYQEGGACGDATTLFVAANFATSPIDYSADNGVYKSTNAGNSWTKMTGGWWPSTTVQMRDLAISPAYTESGQDHTLYAATSNKLFRWDGSGWQKCATDNNWTDIKMVAVPPSYNYSSSCSYGSVPGLSCRTVFASATYGGVTQLWFSINDGVAFYPINPSGCPGGVTCPQDVTGIAFPSNFGTGSTPSLRIIVSSSTKGVLTSQGETYLKTPPSTYFVKWQIWDTANIGIPTNLNVADIAADPRWVDDNSSPTDMNIICAVPYEITLEGREYGVYSSIVWPPGWGNRRWSHCESVTFAQPYLDYPIYAMAGFLRDPGLSGWYSSWGACLSSDSGQHFSVLNGYWSLPPDVFSTVAHERNPNYVFASSPSMGVFVSTNKGDSFHPYNLGKSELSPCYLTNGYGITMLANRRGLNLDVLYVGTTDGIKSRYIYYDPSGAGTIHLYEENVGTANGWRNSTLYGGGNTTGYWERLEVVPNSSSNYPIWAVSPFKSGYTAQGFAALPAGSYEGWVFQNSGLSSLDSKGVRLGYGSGSGGVQPLISGSPIKETVKHGEWDYYSIDVANSDKDLQVFMKNDLNDPDVYVRYGALPTFTSYDFRPYVGGADETVCVVPILEENFDESWGPFGDNPPTGWTIADYGGESPMVWDNNDWHRVSNGAYGYSAQVYYYPVENQIDELKTPTFVIPSTMTSATLDFDHYFHWFSAADIGKIWLWDGSAWHLLASYTTDTGGMVHAALDLTPYIGKSCYISFQYNANNGWWWTVDNVRISGIRPNAAYPYGAQQMLKTGTWYIGVEGYSGAGDNNYTLTATLDTGCIGTTSFSDSGIGKDPKYANYTPDPKAPVASTTWGTVNLTGVVKGTGSSSIAESGGGTPQMVSWVVRNGLPPYGLTNLKAKTVIQLPDTTLVVGCDASSSSDKGIWYSPAGNEGLTAYYEASAVASEGSKNYVDVIQASNGDVLMAGSGTGTGSSAGGVWLSGDTGRNWMRISRGFDSSSQELADIVQDSGDPPSYYASTDTTGLWTRTVSASPYPTITNISPDNGTSAGGTPVTITGTGFSNSCPTGAAADCPNTTPRVLFGETEVAGAWVSSTQITATTPAHSSGPVSVKVRNPDTRQTAVGSAYTFSITCSVPSGMSNNTAVDADSCLDSGVGMTWSDPADWGDGGTGTRTFDVLRNGGAIATGISSATHSYNDTTGTNGVSYTYSVRANNGCAMSSTTSGTSAADAAASAPSGLSNNSASDVDVCEDSGVSVNWSDPAGWGDNGVGSRTFDVFRDGGAIATGISSSTHTYTDTTGTNGQSYAYTVRANNGCSLSATTAGASAADVVCAPPEVADGVYPNIQSWSGNTQSWPAASRASGYYLYRMVSADLANLQNSSNEGCKRDVGNVTSYGCSGDDSSIVTGKVYFYLVTGYNGTGEGSAGGGTGFTRNLSTSTTCP
jgi:hypothetical protein